MIFCVEDDSNIRELVVYTLESTGFQARGFEDGSSFLEALALNERDSGHHGYSQGSRIR